MISQNTHDNLVNLLPEFGDVLEIFFASNSAGFVYFHFALPLIFSPAFHIMLMVDAAEAAYSHNHRERIEAQNSSSSGKACGRVANSVQDREIQRFGKESDQGAPAKAR
jgi:hypothetical protein